MRYTFKQFKDEYPDDDACLQAVFDNRFSDLKYCPKCGGETKWYRVKKRQSYACMHCGHHLYPLADTIFRKSTTGLWNWFYAIYLFSVAKNGVSAKELERHLGVTYKTAWRMCKQIRILMAEEHNDTLGGNGSVVEMDEAYIGGKAVLGKHKDNKTAVFGAVERLGFARASVTDVASKVRTADFLRKHVTLGTELHTDESRLYVHTKKTYKHLTVHHKKGIYVKKGVHTNTIEGFWAQMKRSMDGTYHCVSPKYLQNYVDEFTFRYNYRDVPIYPLLMAKV